MSTSGSEGKITRSIIGVCVSKHDIYHATVKIIIYKLEYYFEYKFSSSDFFLIYKTNTHQAIHTITSGTQKLKPSVIIDKTQMHDYFLLYKE